MIDIWVTGSVYDTLPQMSDRKFDLVIADPPYEDAKLINFTIEQGLRLRKQGGCLLVFMYPEDLLSLKHKPDQILHWMKPPSTKNTVKKYSRFVEVICCWHGGYFNPNAHWSEKAGIFTDRPQKHEHPWRKPRSLIESLVHNHCPDGGYILDPFAGSGVVREIALGKYGVYSIELDAKWRPAELPVPVQKRKVS